MDKKINENKNENKQAKSRKTTVIVACAVAAAVIVAVVLALTLGKSDGPKTPDGTDTQKGAVTVPANTDDTAAPDDTSKQGGSEKQDDTKKPDVTSGTDDTSKQGGSEKQDDTKKPDDSVKDTEEPVITDMPEPEVFVTEGPVENGEKSPWPADKLPAGIPEFKNIIKFYTCTYQDNDDIEQWYMSWDAKQADYDKWMADVAAAGFNQSISVVGFCGNGDVIMDITTEDYENGVVWVSVDIYRSLTTHLPDDLAKIYPEIDTTASVWYANEGAESFSIAYQCAKDWEGDLAAYVEKLAAAGFEMSYCKAEKTVDGKTFSVTWGNETKNREIITYTYGD